MQDFTRTSSGRHEPAVLRQLALRAAIGMALGLVALFATVAVSADAAAPAQKQGIKVGVSKPKGGQTVVTYDGSVASLLASLGVSASPIAPATSPTPPQYSFPITGGRINYAKTNRGRETKRNINGWVDHSGGIQLTRANPAVTVTLTNPRINLGAHRDGTVSLRVNGGGRVAVYSMSGVTVDPADKSISATLKLTRDGANALNGAFGVTAWVAGSLAGTVKTTPTF